MRREELKEEGRNGKIKIVNGKRRKNMEGLNGAVQDGAGDQLRPLKKD